MANPNAQPDTAVTLSRILDKSPRDFVRADILKVIEKRRVERLTFHYTALDGKLKELKIPAADRAQVELVLAEGERVDGSSLFKGLVDMALSDLYVVPQYSTAFFSPFDEGSLDFVCRYLGRDGNPAPFTLDNVLRRAAELFRSSTGLDLEALGELEFFLLTPGGEKAYAAPGLGGYHDSLPFVRSGPILNEMVRNIIQVTGAVKYAHAEVGLVECVRSDTEEIQGRRAEQLEIEYLPRPVEEMADALVLGRWIIRTTAYRNGAIATFTPKIAIAPFR